MPKPFGLLAAILSFFCLFNLPAFGSTPSAGSISINDGSPYANSPSATLNISADDALEMKLSNNNVTWLGPYAYSATKTWALSPYGDVSGNSIVDIIDALFIAQYLAGIRQLTPGQLALADVKDDGAINIIDALFIAQYLAGIRALPARGGQRSVYVKFKDAAGNWSQALSDTIILDTTPPALPIVTDDGKATTSTIELHASWASLDDVSGIAEYQYRIIRDSPNGVILADWTSTGIAASATNAGLSLALDKSYYFSVKARNNAGLWSEEGYSDGIKVVTVLPPEIINITPADNSTFLAGARINIQITAFGPNPNSLEYRFLIGAAVKQGWSSLNTYAWQASSADTGTVTFTCEVRDNNTGQAEARTIAYQVVNPAPEEILQKVADNYARIYDFKADMTLSSTLNGTTFGETDYCKYYFKAPDKEKTESYSDSNRTVKTEIIINNGSNMYLIDPINKLTQEVDLLTEAGISASEFNQMDMNYNQANFLSNHTITRNNNDTDFNNFIIALEAIPKAQNNLYSKLELFIDYKKGLVIKIGQYKNDELPQIIEAIETELMPSGAWIISKVKKTPNLKSGNLVVILSYDNIQMNTGQNDLDFDPDKQ